MEGEENGDKKSEKERARWERERESEMGERSKTALRGNRASRVKTKGDSDLFQQRGRLCA